jgi:hypothetical protein
MVAGKLDESMKRTLNGLSNGTDRMIIDRLLNVKIKVGESFQERVPRVIISTTDPSSLCRGVEYM